jgi:hypothetical protein
LEPPAGKYQGGRRSLTLTYEGRAALPAPAGPRQEVSSVDVLLPECRCLNFRLKVAAHLNRLGEALAIPGDAVAVGREILKFLATLALIAVYGLVLLMLE